MHISILRTFVLLAFFSITACSHIGGFKKPTLGERQNVSIHAVQLFHRSIIFPVYGTQSILGGNKKQKIYQKRYLIEVHTPATHIKISYRGNVGKKNVSPSFLKKTQTLADNITSGLQTLSNYGWDSQIKYTVTLVFVDSDVFLDKTHYFFNRKKNIRITFYFHKDDLDAPDGFAVLATLFHELYHLLTSYEKPSYKGAVSENKILEESLATLQSTCTALDSIGFAYTLLNVQQAYDAEEQKGAGWTDIILNRPKELKPFMKGPAGSLLYQTMWSKITGGHHIIYDGSPQAQELRQRCRAFVQDPVAFEAHIRGLTAGGYVSATTPDQPLHWGHKNTLEEWTRRQRHTNPEQAQP